ncbi:unnamed protein product [Darwinula stevensoni]|uniref:STAT transcription factor protein interaction domain-containing protein n=1 Tax=Darwinula stevensoni TaxID=69355 RepID=A0A7R9FSG0_9CRUS|nr:unnamed protein product [Darwinula stevensoni]CAG0903451.1 unnamed protein product [Darwinula stevensoni]
MALWAKIQELPADTFLQVQALYHPDHFPIEVRHYLANWIEEQNWSEIAQDGPGEERASALVSALIRELQRAQGAVEGANFVARIKLAEAIASFAVSGIFAVDGRNLKK